MAPNLGPNGFGSGGGSGGGSAAVPVVMTANLTLPADTQTLFRVPITIGPFRIIGGSGSILVGV
jgi:hypothetical protein